MKKVMLGIMVLLSATLLVGCSGRGPRTLSDKYVKVTDYQGVEIEPVTVEETTDDEVDQAVDYMRRLYVRGNDLDENAPITDEMVQELSQTSKTVDEYKAEIRKQVEESRENSAREEEETRAWEKVIDNSTVKKYPKDRLKHVKDNLKDMYQRYADQAGVSYEEYLKATKVTDKDIDKAAKASLKQELVADVIANYYGLKPTEEEFQEGLQEYVDKYNLTNVDTLLATVSEDDMRTLITEKNVMSWVTDRCRYVKSSDSKDTTDSKSSDSKTSDSKTSDATESSDKESK
mgnify:FL=1